MSDVVELYRNTIIGHLINAGTPDLLLLMIQCWRVYKVGKENQSLHMVLYCSGIMFKYYSHLGFLLIKHNEEGTYIHN